MGKDSGPKKAKQDNRKKTAKRAQSAKAERRRRPVLTTFKILGFTVGSLVVLGVAGGVGYAASMLKGLPKVSAATFSNNRAPSVVYDKTGKVIGRIQGDGDRQPISSIQQVSPKLKNAFIAAEDKTFYANIGINPLAMGRAAIQDVLGHRIESGASTITQQTVKLAVFPEQQRTLRRKIQEIALALEVTHQLTKNEILTDYMNWVDMGNLGSTPVYGVKRASEILFGKDPKNLTLAESAFVAAIPNNPSYFSPYQYPKHTIARQHYILQQMLDDNMITQAEYNQAIHFNILKDLHAAPKSGLPSYPYLMLDEIEPRVCQELVNEKLYDNVADAKRALSSAGLSIYTTIDLSKQKDITKVLADPSLFEGTNKTYQPPKGKAVTDYYQAGVTLVDNKTGGILAVGGGRDFTKDNYDHADYARQPGSSIKPLLDYGPAIDTKILTASSLLYDAPTQFSESSGNWDPKDDEDDFAGLMTARVALYESRNVPAIDVLETLTPQTGFQYLNKMGMGPTDKTLTGDPTIVADDENHLSSAIGGLDNGVTVEQMTSAYSTFANQGVWRQGYMIQKIKDNTGHTIYTAHPKTAQVYSPATAYIITNMLHDVLYTPGGTATSVGAQFPGQYISGKTGTTDSLEDGWFVGYTKDYTLGVWMGYNHHEPIYNINQYNEKFTVWSDIMKPILQQKPATTPWPKPANVVAEDVSSSSGMLPTAASKADGSVYTEYYIDGTQPTQTDDIHVEAKYVVIDGKKYLATTNTPPADVKTGTFIKIPSDIPDMAHKIPGGYNADTPYLLPTQADPRGGQILDDGSTPGNGSTLPAPTGLNGHVAGNQVVLNWQAVTGANTYEVYRSTSQNGQYQDLGKVTGNSFTDSQLPTNANAVYYEVYAISSSAMSDASAPYGIQLPSGTVQGDENSTTNGTANQTDNNTTTDDNTSDTTNQAKDSTGKTTSDDAPTKDAQRGAWMPGIGEHGS
jgi:penicillin-binding protein/penicillin-binding protein 1A